MIARLTFRTLSGAPIEARAVRVSGTQRGVWIAELGLAFDLSPTDWALVEFAGAFQATAHARGPCFGGPLDDDRPVHARVQLGPAGLRHVRARVADLAEAEALLAADPGPLASSESWILASVTQGDGPIRRGFRTDAAGW